MVLARAGVVVVVHGTVRLLLPRFDGVSNTSVEAAALHSCESGRGRLLSLRGPPAVGGASQLAHWASPAGGPLSSGWKALSPCRELAVPPALRSPPPPPPPVTTRGMSRFMRNQTKDRQRGRGQRKSSTKGYSTVRQSRAARRGADRPHAKPTSLLRAGCTGDPRGLRREERTGGREKRRGETERQEGKSPKQLLTLVSFTVFGCVRVRWTSSL